MKERNARKVYQDYIEEMNDEWVTRELIAYQDYADYFAIIEIKGKTDRGNWVEYQIIRIDYCGRVDPIRTYSDLTEARIALLALAYKSKPIIELPF